MKKILTLLIAVSAFASVKAQTTKEEARRIILGDGNSNRPATNNRDVILGDNRNNYPSDTYPNSKESRRFKKTHTYRHDRNDGCDNNGKHKGWHKKQKNKNWKKGHRD